MENYSIPHIKMRDIAKIYDLIEMGILISDGEGTLIWGNAYYSKMAGFDVSEYFGKNVRDISGREDIQLPGKRKMIDDVLEKRCTQTAVVKYHIDDYIITTASPLIESDGSISYIIYVMTNYTRLDRLQEKLSKSSMQVQALESHLKAIQAHSSIGDDIVAVDNQMLNIYGKALRLADTSVSVMITGESGSGKDVLAKYIHTHSNRSHENFIHVNMASIPYQLFESELFGYTPGSFSGASKNGKIGLVQLSDKGTLFLDEIGELPLDTQAKLLHVIQNKEVRAIGAVDSSPVDCRIICATNRDLEQMVRDKQFRLDLYYRLNAVEIEIPPLRQRKDDIPALTNFFMNKINGQNGTDKYLTPDVIRAFSRYSWPGNVRELQHLLESMCALSSGDRISVNQLPAEFNTGSASVSDQSSNSSLDALLREYEINLIRSALKRNPSAAKAAEELGIDASTLSKKRKRYGI